MGSAVLQTKVYKSNRKACSLDDMLQTEEQKSPVHYSSYNRSDVGNKDGCCTSSDTYRSDSSGSSSQNSLRGSREIDDSPYAGGVFYLRITYPSNYPFQAPKIEFTTTIFHPNIDQNSGEIYLSIFHSDWCFAYSISTGKVSNINNGVLFTLYQQVRFQISTVAAYSISTGKVSNINNGVLLTLYQQVRFPIPTGKVSNTNRKGFQYQQVRFPISTVLLSILALLTSPNPECPFDQEASILYKQDRKKYNETAAEWTRKYAM
ncbi:UBC4 [Mytilus edulis]|uniref:UBE2D n=1 Tax=Mytilus edulis TaxID=6550 RepID=A0A8S3ULS6_MYTED|nr:UBC4 [Mytilus edulis]